MHALRCGVALWALTLMSGYVAISDTKNERYTMSPTGGDLLRLDKETRAMALRTQGQRQWVCKSTVDREHQPPSDMYNLRTKSGSLRQQVDDMDEILEIGPQQPSNAWPSTNFALPCETDVDRAFEYSKGILCKPHERIAKLEKRQASTER